MERDLVKLWLCLKAVHFNSHAHVERDLCRHYVQPPFDNFNSHAHVERDCEAEDIYDRVHISTHTLTWSVTLDVVYIWCLLHMMRTYFLFIWDRFDFIHYMFTKSMAFTCELSGDSRSLEVRWSKY